MSNSRRSFLKGISLSSGGVLLSPMLGRFAAHAAGVPMEKMPKRFVFIVKSSGIIPERLEPESLRKKLADKSVYVNEPLAKHKLPDSLSPLEPVKKYTSIIQGLSGKMCKGGHSSWFGALGVYKTGGEHNSGVILRATVDHELAKLNPAPFVHVGLALRGKVMGKETEGTLYPGITALGKGRELPFQASPDMAYEQLFGSAITNTDRAKMRNRLKGKLLDFMVDDIKTLQRKLPRFEREKMEHYLHAFEELQVRRQRLGKLSEQIKKHAPEFSDRFSAKNPTSRQSAHFDLIAAALISGITNVVTMRLDNISTNYGDLGLSDKNVHGIGHGEICNGKTPEQARDIIRKHHAKLIVDLAKKLQAMPEGSGNMLDNTMIVYMSDAANKHHADNHQWPFIVVGGCANKLNIAGRYIQFPEYGATNHHTIGNWYTTILNAFGNRIEHYGNLDLNLQKNGVKQTGAIGELLTG